ncbi:hypothetical protein Lser_V15G26920 [Lactuca serriola]
MIKILESIHLFLLIYLSFTSFLAQSAPQNAIVSQVPGFNGILPSKHYAGYVTLNENHGKKLYYIIMCFQKETLLRIQWFFGSMVALVAPVLMGLFSDKGDHLIGPFDFEKTESMPKLHINPYAWNKNRSDYINSDVITTLDSHKFLLEWFKLYPEYLSNPFFIAGEAFAGIYIPLLSDQVMKGLEAGDKPTLNFKGYIIGNGLCDEASDHNAIVPFAHGMGLISDELYQDVTKVCEGKFYKPPSLECEFQLDKVYQHLDGLNVDNIIKPCFIGKKIRHENTKLPLSFRKLGETERPLPVRTRMFGRAWPFKAAVKPGYAPSWLELLNATQIRGSPCSDDSVAIKWLNNEAVRKAIHADPISKAGKWEICTGRVKYNSEVVTMIDYHKKLTAGGYRALIYRLHADIVCGDHDLRVPYTGTEAWTRSLGYKVIDEWRSWKVDGQIAGYTQGYDKNLTFLTVKGAGHRVPEYKPKEALVLYSRWLEGKKI